MRRAADKQAASRRVCAGWLRDQKGGRRREIGGWTVVGADHQRLKGAGRQLAIADHGKEFRCDSV